MVQDEASLVSTAISPFRYFAISLFRYFSGYRVKPAPSPWMASADPFKGHPQPSECSVFSDGLDAVNRTTWRIPARGHQVGGNGALVKTDQ